MACEIYLSKIAQTKLSLKNVKIVYRDTLFHSGGVKKELYLSTDVTLTSSVFPENLEIRVCFAEAALKKLYLSAAKLLSGIPCGYDIN